METKTVVAPEIEQELVAPPRAIPKAEHLEPFGRLPVTCPSRS